MNEIQLCNGAGISTIRQNNFVQTRHENSKVGKIDNDIIKTKIDIKQSNQTSHTLITTQSETRVDNASTARIPVAASNIT